LALEDTCSVERELDLVPRYFSRLSVKIIRVGVLRRASRGKQRAAPYEEGARREGLGRKRQQCRETGSVKVASLSFWKRTIEQNENKIIRERMM